MGAIPIVVDGTGSLADALRAGNVHTETAATVVVPRIATKPIPFHELTDEDFGDAWEQPMRDVIEAFQRAHGSGCTRIIAIVPTIGMSGAPRLAHAAATAEAVRVLVKSAARQWGADGVTVNCLAVAPEAFGLDTGAVGTVSIAPAALAAPSSDDLGALVELLAGDGARSITGATVTADGGVWMAP